MKDDVFEGTKIPFNTYDFFGYLIPGASFLFINLMLDLWARGHFRILSKEKIHTPFLTVGQLLLKHNINSGELINLLYILIGVLLAYIAGHIVASISSFSIDRFLLRNGLQYPLKTFIYGAVDGQDPQFKSKSDIVKQLFVLWNLGLVSFFIFLANYENFYLLYQKTYSRYLIFLLITLIVILLIFKRFSRLFDFGASAVSRYFGLTGGRLNSEVKEAFKKKIEASNVIKHAEAETSDMYWYAFTYVSKNCSLSGNMLMNWLHLYSFARNLSTAFYMSFLYSITIICCHLCLGSAIPDDTSFFICIGLYIASFIMLGRFYYLYASYFTKYLIRAFVFTEAK